MNQSEAWLPPQTYVLQELELFNWGGFNGPHRAQIDPEGTAVIGSTGSGKTTLVDALMTLLAANPRYNLASTGGHESDRDLVSYVRGVSGPGDGSGTQNHIARAGPTVTGVAATLQSGDNLARLGAIFWFDDTSSSAADMKKLWLFTTKGSFTLEHWLTLHHEGGKRAMRQVEKTETGVWTYNSKKGFLARVRDFFEVRENAFNLLNRAAGLKQLNSIDEIFRELVLDDTSQFDRAREVASSFDDLTAIHEELEIARRQLRSLEPVKTGWEKYQANEAVLKQKTRLNALLPVWFGEQAHRLWQAEHGRLSEALQLAEADKLNLVERYTAQHQTCEQLNEVYLRVGGSDISVLEELIQARHQDLRRCQNNARDYQVLAQQLELPGDASRHGFAANQHLAAAGLAQTQQKFDAATTRAFECGTAEHTARAGLTRLQEELTDARQRPGSNIPPAYQKFREALAEHLCVDENDLPFVAELVSVKDEEAGWRGAIERAMGHHRLRVLVPPEAADAALRWVNQRHNALDVRILEVELPATQPIFWEDGYTRKLTYKAHPYREAVKDLLAGIDRHCVAGPEQLRQTQHAMTQQGLMSGKARFFDKLDQRRLDENWLTGFDNRDRLTALTRQIAEATAQLQQAEDALRQAAGEREQIGHERTLWQRLQQLSFDELNVAQAQQALATLEVKLAALTARDSDVARAKQALNDARDVLTELDVQRSQCIATCSRIATEKENADHARTKALRKAQEGLTGEQRDLAQQHLPQMEASQLQELEDIERATSDVLGQELDALKEKRGTLGKNLTGFMSDAKREDRGALAEVGRDLTDVPEYLRRLQTLVDEALPEKLKRFKEYLNRSSDEGVTQLLMTVDNEVERIEEKLEEVNRTLRRVDFQHERFLQLVSTKVVHESLRTFHKARQTLASARFADDDGESQYKALQRIVALLSDACERSRNLAAKALLDPRFRLEFKVSVIDRRSGTVIETRSGSQGGSGGEKEIIASYVLTASLSYALCPDGSPRPLFGTIVLDEAFSRSSHTVAGRIIAALKEFGLHALFITPNKEIRLLRNHTRSAIVVHRHLQNSTLTALSWQELKAIQQRRVEADREVTR